MASSSSSQPYSELTWETAFRRGRHLVEAMRGNSSQATTILGYPSQSQFRTRHDLVDCGWVREDESSMLVTIGTEIAYLPQLETYDLDFSRVKAWGWWHRNSGVNRGTQFDVSLEISLNLECETWIFQSSQADINVKREGRDPLKGASKTN